MASPLVREGRVWGHPAVTSTIILTWVWCGLHGIDKSYRRRMRLLAMRLTFSCMKSVRDDKLDGWRACRILGVGKAWHIQWSLVWFTLVLDNKCGEMEFDGLLEGRRWMPPMHCNLSELESKDMNVLDGTGLMGPDRTFGKLRDVLSYPHHGVDYNELTSPHSQYSSDVVKDGT